jgi:hypothetical protein
MQIVVGEVESSGLRGFVEAFESVFPHSNCAFYAQAACT